MTTRRWLDLAGVVLGFGLGRLLWAVLFSGLIFALREQELLHGIDHQAVRKACRELLHQADAGRLLLGIASVSRGTMPRVGPLPTASSLLLLEVNEDRSEIREGNSPRLPDVIRGLRPSYVVVGEGWVRLEFGAGFQHYGLMAYAEGAEGHPVGDLTARRLVEGLWHYRE
jgi:hypothetical protein